MHLVKELQRQLPAAALLAGRKQRVVCDDVPLAPILDHLVERVQRLVELTGLAIGRDQCRVCRRDGGVASITEALVHLKAMEGVYSIRCCFFPRRVLPFYPTLL